LYGLLRSESSEVRVLAVRLGAQLDLAETPELRSLFAEATDQAMDVDRPTEQRRQAAEILTYAPYATSAPVMAGLLDARQPLELQHAAIESLNASDDAQVATTLLNGWKGLTPKVRDAVLKAVLARENRLASLLDALESNVVRRGDIRAIDREQLIYGRDKELATRARKLFADAAAGSDLQKRFDRYLKALDNQRDPSRGKEVFTKTCLTCHKLKDEGFEVGPLLGSVINRPDEAILLDILDPNRHIDSEFSSYIIVTADGRTFTGVLVSESATSVTLRAEKGDDQTILRKDIELIRTSDVSLMPSNLHEQISPQQAADLLTFLRVTFGS
jgi:putative heme-binding domain-containing protein